ncbi:TPA: ead/Ea22-like family protein [Escherichia coli]
MSKIDHQALREAAEKATCGEWSLEYGEGRFDGDDALIHREVAGYIPICRIEGAHPESGFDEDFQMEQQANAEFIAAANPATVLALLDERERNQQYIKLRDQENEDIALTVGKLRVELEAAENNLIDSECHVAELEEALRDKQALLEASEKRIAELEAEPVSQAYKLNALDGNSPVTPDGWISRFEEMPDPSSEKRVCAFTPTNHEDMRYRFVPASLFKTVCRDATHWFYMLPPVGREEVAGG